MEFQNTNQYIENLEPIGTQGNLHQFSQGLRLHLTALQPSHSPPPLPSLSPPSTPFLWGLFLSCSLLPPSKNWHPLGLSGFNCSTHS